MGNARHAARQQERRPECRGVDRQRDERHRDRRRVAQPAPCCNPRGGVGERRGERDQLRRDLRKHPSDLGKGTDACAAIFRFPG